MKLSTILIAALCLFGFQTYAQKQKPKTASPTFTPAPDRIASLGIAKKLEENSLVKNIPFRNVGPTIMSGRVVDVDVDPNDPTHFYVAYASGGLWFTDNNGISFTPVFDKEAVITIGDIAIDWDSNTIYVGTGENNSSRSSYSGVGIYKSIDGGKTWQNMGLEETHHIGRIILNPTNPNLVYVAAIGHLYSANKERGIFKSTDGGKTWKQTLFIDETTGCIDLVIDPKNPNILYTSSWHRERNAWNFTESGSASGIYKSIDAGTTWQLVSIKESGFPTGDGVGRIGLTISPQQTNTLYAVVDNQARRPKEKKEAKPALEKDSLRLMSKEKFLSLNDELINGYLDKNDFPKKYTAKTVKEMVKSDKIKPIALVEFTEDANAQLFETDVTGAEVYRSDDAGKTWKKQNTDFINNLFNTYGYYFGLIRVSPFDMNEIYIGGVPVLKSTDGGKTYKSIDADNMHGDYHSIWLDANRRGHMLVGNDGGLNISYDSGKTYFKCNTPAVGQFYAVAVDMDRPYNVYGGLQDNGVWTGSSTYKFSYGWYDGGKYPYKFILGGDGMQVQVDTRDNNTVYSGFQFGYYYRINKTTGETNAVQPQIELGERPLRFNWQTPIKLSSFNNDILYLGSNKLHRSFDKGENWQTLSGDLTTGGKKGDVAFGTITTLDESTLKFGLIYTGSDDGLIHVTKDGGNNWTKISDKLPQGLWVSRVISSRYKDSRVYASLNGFRNDDMKSYLFLSNDYGTTWTTLGTDLPLEPINVVREDPKNENIIYVGTDNGLYTSINGGKTFMAFNNGLPRVAVHDLVIHPRDNEIVVGTHGRSIYIADVSLLQQLNDTMLLKEIYAFDINAKRYSTQWGKRDAYWEDANTPSIQFSYYVNTNSIATINIKAGDEITLATFKDTAETGINYFSYDLTLTDNNLTTYTNWVNKDKKEADEKAEVIKADNGKYYLQAGKYLVEIITANGKKSTTELIIKAPEKRVRGENSGQEE